MINIESKYMEMRQLRYFVAVAEELNFGRAARRLRLSQPPLSMQIKALEEELGVGLLERSTRRVALTDAGRTFLKRARIILSEVEEARAEAKDAGMGLRGELEIGFISSATLTLLPPAIRAFRERFGAVKLELKELTSGQQVEALHGGEIRIGLVRLPLQAPGIHIEPMLEEAMILALPSDHPLVRLESVPLEEIVDQPLIFFTPRLIPGFHTQIVEMFQSVGAFPEVAQHAVHMQTIVGLVASGIGVAILPGSAQKIQREGVVYRALDAPGATSWVALAWLEGDSSTLVEHFVQTVRQVAGDGEFHLL